MTSLTVTWSAPANAGPAITDYDVQYRAGTTGDWSDGGHTGTATTATLSSLSENTSYQVQVRATNDEGTGSWSDSGTGRTTDANAAPAFSSNATFDAAENQTAAGTVRATDSDNGGQTSRATQSPAGRTRRFFSIGATSGVLTFNDGAELRGRQRPGHEQHLRGRRSTATSGTGTREKTATQTITVTVTDVAGEAPDKPAAPDVAAASTTSLTVNWSAPSNAGPAITDYDVQYRAGMSGSWSDGGHAGTAVTATLTGLSENTSYQVQVRATNDEGTGSWSDSGSGTTANAVPPPAPMISSLEVRSWPQRDRHEDVYGFGETIVFTLTWSEKVRVKGQPTLAFDLGGQAREAWFYGLTDTDFVRGAPPPRPRQEGVKVHFGYTVKANDLDDDGVAVGANAIQRGGARIRSAATGLDANLSHAVVGPLSGHKVDGGTTAKPGSVTIIDTDGDPLVMHEDGRHRLVIREGTKGRYGLKLDTRPTHTVHLRGIQSDGDEDLHVLSNHTVLPIAPDEWKTPIWMVIQAEQDDDAVNGERVFLNSVHSRDPAYNSLTLPDVLVVEDDDDATGSMSVVGDAHVRDIGAARLCSAVAGGDDANPAAVAAALWEDGDMSEDRLAALDSLGNGNGSYDLGDLLAWMNRCRRGEGPGSASSTEPPSPPPALPPSRTKGETSRRRKGARGPSRSRRKAPDPPAAGSRTRRSGWLRTALLAALISAWGCGDGIVGPRADAPRHDGAIAAFTDPGPLHVRLTAPPQARDIGAMLVIEGPAIDSVQAPGLEIFETDESSSTRREVVIAGALAPDAPVLRVWVPHRGDEARYRIRLLQVAGEDFSLRDLAAYGTAISR